MLQQKDLYAFVIFQSKLLLLVLVLCLCLHLTLASSRASSRLCNMLSASTTSTVCALPVSTNYLCVSKGARASHSGAFSTTAAVSNATLQSSAQGRSQQSSHSCVGQVSCLTAETYAGCTHSSVCYEVCTMDVYYAL